MPIRRKTRASPAPATPPVAKGAPTAKIRPSPEKATLVPNRPDWALPSMSPPTWVHSPPSSAGGASPWPCRWTHSEAVFFLKTLDGFPPTFFWGGQGFPGWRGRLRVGPGSEWRCWCGWWGYCRDDASRGEGWGNRRWKALCVREGQIFAGANGQPANGFFLGGGGSGGPIGAGTRMHRSTRARGTAGVGRWRVDFGRRSARTCATANNATAHATAQNPGMFFQLILALNFSHCGTKPDEMTFLK